MKADLDAAITLGISDQAYNRNVDISGAEKYAIENGIFRPYVPSSNVIRAFQENASALGENNPYIDAASTINDIRAELSGLSLDDPVFPIIDNPLMQDAGTPQTIPGTYNLPNIDQQTVAAQGIGVGGNIPFNQMTTQQKLYILFGRG